LIQILRIITLFLRCIFYVEKIFRFFYNANRRNKITREKERERELIKKLRRCVQNNVYVAWNAFDPNATSSSYLACTKLKGRNEFPFLPPISFSYALSQLPCYVLLLIWWLWHFNFHLTRLAYIIFIIQANLLVATRLLTVSLGHFKRTKSPWRRRWVAFAGGERFIVRFWQWIRSREYFDVVIATFLFRLRLCWIFF